MSATRYSLAVDLGTSAVKLALVSSRGAIAAFTSRPVTVALDAASGSAEADPEAWWAAIVDGTRELLATRAVAPADIDAVGISGQWSGTIAVDASGNPLAPALTWMDARGARHIRALTGGPIRVAGYGVDKLLAWIPKTGGIPQHSGKDPIAHLRWLATERPDVYRAAHRFLEPVDWLGHRFSGRFATTPATVTLHWVTDNRDLARVRYDPALVRRSGIVPSQLPEIVPPASILGAMRPDAARELGFRDDVRVAAGAPDIHAAAVGAGAVRNGETHLCVGTSSWLCAHVPRKRTDVIRNMAALPSALPDRYLLVNEQESAGTALGWARSVLGGIASDAEFDALAASAPAGAGGVLFAPWLNGERSPIDDPTLRGAFVNLGLGTTRGQLARAVLEGVALNLRWLLEGVEAFTHARSDAIRAIGGGARSALWCQIFADALGRPVLQMAEPERATARGAGLIAGLAMGWLAIEEIPAIVPVARRFEPAAEAGRVYERMFRELKRLYRSTRGIGARLAGT